MQKTQTMVFRVDPSVDLSGYDYPRFSPEEYADRHRRVREWMIEHKLDCLLVSGSAAVWDQCWTNVNYLTNHLGSMELHCYCVFPLEGDPTLCVLTINGSLPDRAGRAVISDLRGGVDYAAMAADRIVELGLTRGRIGVVELAVGISIPWNHYQTFAERLPDAKLRFVTKEWWRFRRIKSAAEIAEIEKAAELGDLGMDALATARPGMTETELFATAYDAVFRNGADCPSMMLISSTSMANPDSCLQRNRPLRRTLAKGDIILSELGPKTPTLYCSQVGRPLTLGEPTHEYQEMWKVAVETYYAVVDRLRPGNSSKDVFECTQIPRKYGYEFDSPLIHGMFGIPESAPRATSWGWQEDTPFAPNQVVTVEAHIASRDRLRGIWVGSGYLIAEGEPRCLSRLPVEIRVLDV